MEALEASATLRFTRISAQKARLTANLIRGKAVTEAKGILAFSPRKGAAILLKLLNSAIANAEGKNAGDPETLEVSKIWVNSGPVYKRQLARARGRADTIRKPTSHITIVVRENTEAKAQAQAKIEAMRARKLKKAEDRKAGKAGGTPDAAKTPGN
jgi:large subunit ribosomal protein L22